MTRIRTSVFVGSFLIAAVAGLLALWMLRSDSIPAEAAVAAGQAVEGSSEPDGRRIESIDGSADPVSAEPGDPAEPAAGGPLAMRRHALAAAMYQVTGSRVVASLTSAGLAPSDSERIARSYSEDLAECATTSLASEAARQAIPVDELTARLGRAIGSGDLNVSDMSMYDVTVAVSGVIDVASVEAGLQTCWLDATQRAGISFESEVEAVRDRLPR